MAHDRAVDIPGDDQHQRIGRLAPGPLDPGGVEQAEGDVKGLAEAPVGVVVAFSRVAEQGDHTGRQERLGGLVDRVDERQDAAQSVTEFGVAGELERVRAKLGSRRAAGAP
jgi:hypothetical protein